MRDRIFATFVVFALLVGLVAFQQTARAATAKDARTADGHPDLSGMWSFATSLPPGAVKKVVDGKAVDAAYTVLYHIDGKPFVPSYERNNPAPVRNAQAN